VATVTGLEKLHARGCSRSARCSCTTWRASVWDPRARRKIRRSFDSYDAALRWRADTTAKVQAGELRAAMGALTIREAGEQLVAAMRSGAARNRSGLPYKPSVVSSYESALEQHVYEAMGARRLAQLERRQVQAFVEHLIAQGLAPSTIRNVLMPLRVIYRRAQRDAIVAHDPIAGIELPANRAVRPRGFVTHQDAAVLIACVPDRDRSAWALAFYAGLRLGELLALEWHDVNLAASELHVDRAWCSHTKQVTEPKTAAAKRTVPVPDELRRVLLAHRLLTGRPAGLVVQREDGGVESGDAIADRAEKAWKADGIASLAVGVHEMRHGYASMMIRAAVPITALSRFMGHSSITVTIDRYGHLYPQDREAAAAAVNALLATGSDAVVASTVASTSS
jgi:integrase